MKLVGGKRAHKIQVDVREPSRRHRDTRDRSMNMGLNLALLATETGTSPETLQRPKSLDRPGQTHREVSKRHGSQGEKNHGGGQRDHRAAPEEQKGAEIRKTHHRARRSL